MQVHVSTENFVKMLWRHLAAKPPIKQCTMAYTRRFPIFAFTVQQTTWLPPNYR